MDEVHDMFAPAEENVKAIKDWLVISGINEGRIVYSDNKGWLAFDATSKEAGHLFQTEYHEYEHASSDNMRVGCDKYDPNTTLIVRGPVKLTDRE